MQESINLNNERQEQFRQRQNNQTRQRGIILKITKDKRGNPQFATQTYPDGKVINWKNYKGCWYKVEKKNIIKRLFSK